MGLTIIGKETRKSLDWGYSTLHKVRFLALICCGAPEYLDDAEVVPSEVFAIFPFINPMHITSREKMESYVFAVQKSGYFFPNLMMHRDCEGEYTKDGKVLGEGLLTGNSVDFLKEMEFLLDQDFCKEEKHASRVELAKELRDLLDEEIKSGSGIIIFS